MAWNEPENQNSNKQKDPWTGREKKNSSENGPPDLDVLLKKMADFLKSQMNKGKGPSSNKPSMQVFPLEMGALAIFLVFLFFWVVSGFFVIQPAERAVVLRFGQYNETLMPGLHWVPRLIDSVYRTNVQQIYTYTFPQNEDTHMLTRDENIVSVAVNVMYRVDDPKNYLFNVAEPVQSLKQATASAMRQVIGQYNLDDILTTGREQIRAQIETTLKDIIARYKSGLQIVNISIKSASAPEEVKDAFDDAIKAREDQQRIINQAQAYAMKVIPIAQGQAQQLLEVSKADAQKLVLDAQANTAAFLSLLPEYQAAPNVMRERLYLDTMENVLKNSSKILVEGDANKNMLYLPIEQFVKAAQTGNLANLPAAGNTDNSNSTSVNSSSSISGNTTLPTQLSPATSLQASIGEEPLPKVGNEIRQNRPTRFYANAGADNMKNDNSAGGNS